MIIGRNADAILKNLNPFSIFVCADAEAKLKRCRERARNDEKLTDRELLRKMKEIDKSRARTRDFLTGSEWGQCRSYHLTVNTGDWDMKVLAAAVASFAESWFKSKE